MLNIKIGSNRLTFTECAPDLVKAIKEHAGPLLVQRVKDDVLVSGDPAALYHMLYKLSYTYDIELT